MKLCYTSISIWLKNQTYKAVELYNVSVRRLFGRFAVHAANHGNFVWIQCGHNFLNCSMSVTWKVRAYVAHTHFCHLRNDKNYVQVLLGLGDIRLWNHWATNVFLQFLYYSFVVYDLFISIIKHDDHYPVRMVATFWCQYGKQILDNYFLVPKGPHAWRCKCQHIH